MKENENAVQTNIQEAEKDMQGDAFSEPTAAEKDTATAEKPQAQSKETNSEYARRRREIKRMEELKKARIDAIKEVISINPFTNEAILDEDDIEEYILMKKIASEEKDPIKDYPKYVKELKKSSRVDIFSNAEKEKDEFQKAFPNITLEEVKKDELFNLFSKGKTSKMSISEIYLEYGEFLSRVKESAEMKSAFSLAASRASVGSLSDSQSTEGEYYTKDEVSAMSPEEIRKNYDKIRKSQLKW